jgi:cellulose biosynthesis protein BcsQ
MKLPEGGTIGLVAASDNLAYTEMSLTLGWLLQSGERDNRFLLRKALQLMSVRDEYDLILLDCPPLVNISCINALAASDYLLVPATLGRQATERVPVLLERFVQAERFRKNINHDLKVLGVVANRTHREELTNLERQEWDKLAEWCRDATGLEVKRCSTVIPQMLKEIRDAERISEPPPPDSRLASVFGSLATEIEQEFPHECRRTPKALP